MASPFVKAAISTSAVQVIAASTPVASGLLVLASPGNSCSVFVGLSDVTAANGYELRPGAFITIPNPIITNANAVYAIVRETGQLASVTCWTDAVPAVSVGTVTVDSEFPAAAALADNTANPTTTSVAAMGHVWDGATWDRTPGTSADGTLVNLGTNNDVTLAALPSLAAGTALIGKVGLDQTTPGTTNAVAIISGQAGVAGGTGVDGATVPRMTLATNVALPAGTNAIGKLASNTGVTIGAVEVAAAQTLATVTTVTTVTTVSTVTALTGGGVAHDGVDSGNPIKVGGRAVSAEITPVAAADRTDFLTDLVGKQIVLPYANPENFVSGCISSAMTGTTSTSLIGSPGGALRNYITQITVSNSHATVGTDVLIQDGSGGTTMYVIPAAAVFGGGSLTFPVPLRQPTTATAIFAQNVTTGSSIKVSASGYKGV